MRLAEQLRTARDESGYSQRKAADIAGISYVWLCLIENDKGSPTIALVARLAKLYKTEFVISREDSK